MRHTLKSYFRAVTIDGSDSGGGGNPGRPENLAALGCYGMSVITALTAQNTVGVSAIHPVPPALSPGSSKLLEDMGTDAVK